MKPLIIFAFVATLGAGAVASPMLHQQTRDANQRSSSARVSGIVVSAEDGKQPIRRAMVSIEGPSQISQITDDDGRFVFEGLVAGEYAITATRAAFLPAEYGARRPGRLPSRLSVAAGAVINDVTLYMARGAAIEGTVRDVKGEPVANAGVIVAPPGGISSMATVLGSPWLTDDRGVYRAFGLAPGPYIVMATPTVVRRGEIVQPSTTAMDAALRALTDRSPTATSSAPVIPPFEGTVAYGPVFHPNAITQAQAATITVGPGEVRSGIDVSFMLVPTRAIEGIVLDQSGQPATQIQLFISGNGTPNPIFDAAPIMTGRSTTLGAGRFKYTNVTAGRYTVTAKRTGDAPLWAQVQVDVTGTDVTGLELRLQPALTVTGRVVFDGKTLAPPAVLSSVRVSLVPPTGSGGGMANLTNYGLGTSTVVNTDDDGFFTAGMIPGDYLASAFIPNNATATGWWLRSAMIGGVDAVDVPVAIGGSARDVVFTFSDRHSELSGTILTAQGQSATDYYIVAIPADRTLWRPNSRRMKLTRPSTAGRYVFTDLPPGDYLVGAVTDFALSDFGERDTLSRLADLAAKVTIGDGGKVVQDLRVGGGH